MEIPGDDREGSRDSHMAERLRDVLAGSSLGKVVAADQTFTEDEQDLLEELGYEKKGFWWAKDGRMVSKIELTEAIKQKKPQSEKADEYPLPIYMFTYDAKYKARLNPWDTFPVVVVLESAAGGFSGINIHYIDQNIRMQVLAEIMEILDDGGSPAEAMALVSEFKQGYKKYLNSHVRTAIVPIPRSMWEEAFMTPGNFIYK